MAFVAAAPPIAYDGEPAFVSNPVDYVDTLIGTGTGGEIVGENNNFPGAAVPFGMVQYSPDTVGDYAGYKYDNPRSTGFSMTHASAGCAAFGDISMLPTTTGIGSQPWNAWERIAHDDTEAGVPGYYRVRFPETGVTAELTATTRTGVGRFSYPHNGRPALFHVRSGASLPGNSRATIQIGEDNTTITGWATGGGLCGKKNTYTVYFAMKFSQPFTSHGAWDGYAVYAGARRANSPYSGGYVEFPAGSVLEVRTAISYVGIDAARANLAAEGAASFDDVRAAASSEWNAMLSRIAVAGRNGDNLETFYTSLYRSLLHPNTFNDADGRYIGFDSFIHTVANGRTQYTNFSDWDIYRCLAALQALLFPKQASDMAQSLVNDAEQSGALPRWPLANAATGEMTGDSVVPLIVNLYAFGAKDFDVKTALRYMVNAATKGGAGLGGYVERPGIATYLQLGYAPHTLEFRTGGWIADASITLEWSVDDFAISRFADSLGDTATAAEFQNRAQYWQNLFNPTTRYISPRSPTRILPPRPGFCVLSYGLRPGRIRRGQRRAIRLVGAAQRRRPGDRPRRPQGSGRPARPLHQRAQRGPQRALSLGRQRTELRGAVALQLHRSTVEDSAHGQPGARALRSHPRRRAGQRRPRRDVQLVRLGRPRPVPEHPGNADPHRQHTAVRSRRDRPSGRQIHPDLRAGRIRTEPAEVHRGPEHRRPGHRQARVFRSRSSAPAATSGTRFRPPRQGLGRRARSRAPPSFGAGSSAVTVNVSRPVVTIAPGSYGHA